jgi:hypothetical protein
MILRLHGLLHSLISFISPSENELRLTYSLHLSPSRQHQLTIVLLFVPNTRQLADVQISGLSPESDLSDLIGSHIQSNDVPGLIAAVLQQARAETRQS